MRRLRLGHFCFNKTTSNNTHHTMFNEGGNVFNFTFYKRCNGTWYWYIYLLGKRWHA